PSLPLMKLNNLWLLTIFSVSILIGIVFSSTAKNSDSSTKLVADFQAQQEIRIGGHSSTYPAIKILADAYAAQEKSVQISFVLANKSKTAIAAVLDGRLDIGSINEPFKPEENDGSLDYREVAKDALLVGTHPSVNSISNLTTQNLKAIYGGSMRNWKEIGGPNAEIAVLDLPEDEPAKGLLRKYYLGKDLKNPPTAIILKEEEDLMAALQNVIYSIGTFSSAYAKSNQLPVNRLSLNGMNATPKNVDSGRYPMVRPIGLIWKKNSSKAVQAFLDFATSDKGASALRKSDFVLSPR
ncbi:MAG: substrate-binding domain-containing protein, partial [Scytonema sp. PMC 1069.18]|nr:substrate-binding domain-containing protein [Scytonema sp. PMC 1069.18]MEC4886513.1 substrate-binding domain-containing protein [Scytonema sp. PMC 1070.18]